MPEFTFQGLQTGTTVAISAIQGADSASNSVSSWGQGLATVEILAVSAPIMTAPAGLWLEAVNLSGFAANGGPGPGEIYDPSAHEITFVWTVRGAPLSAFQAPQNMVTAWRNANLAYGKRVAMNFPAAGTYTIDLWAVDRQGTTAQAETTIVVVEAASAYPGTNTVCFSPAGDFTGAPPGAQTTTSYAGLQSIIDGASNPLRLLLRKSETYADFQTNVRDGRLTHVGSYGTGAKPVVRPPEWVPKAGYAQTACFNIRDRSVETQITFEGIDFQGYWDSTTETGAESWSPLFWRQKTSATHFTIHGCDFSGFGSTGIGAKDGVAATLIVADCVVTNWQNYGLYTQNNRDETLGFIGCRVMQDVNALNGGDQGKDNIANDHGPFRLSNPAKVYIGQCDVFSRNGWTDADQPCLRLNTSGAEGTYVNVDRCVLEGGFVSVNASGESTAVEENAQNFIFDKVLMIATAAFNTRFARSHFGGCTWRNVIGVVPDVNSFNGHGFTTGIDLVPDGNTQGSTNPGAPVAIYNATFVNLRTAGAAWQAVDSGAAFDTETVENNIVHAPNYGSPVNADAPIDVATVFTGIIPRYAGVEYGFATVSGTLSGNVPDGNSFEIPYASLTLARLSTSDTHHSTASTDKAYWDAILAAEVDSWIEAPSRRRTSRGQIALSTTATGLVVTNNAGEIWTAGTNWRLKVDRRADLKGLDATYASPATIPLPRPLAASDAIGSGDLGLTAYDDFEGAPRPAQGNDRGALLAAP